MNKTEATGVKPEVRSQFSSECFACKPYDEMLQTVMTWVEVS